MYLIHHSTPNGVIAEATSDSVILNNEQDALGMIEELFAFGAMKLILHQKNIAQEFFDLKTGLAGEVLQKFTNYHIQVAIVGDFTNLTSRALNAFIFESNRGNQIFFFESLDVAIQKLSLMV